MEDIEKPSLASRLPNLSAYRYISPSNNNTKSDTIIASTKVTKKTTTQYKLSRHKTKTSNKYAPPSTYIDYPLLPDAVAPKLLVLFVGLNPGLNTSRTGHAYSHPTNMFWKLMYESGITPRPCVPEEDCHLPQLFRLGLTNIVARPSRNGAELSKQEMDDGVSTLLEKIKTLRPQIVCIVGKSVWESIWRVRNGRALPKAKFSYGWQPESEDFLLPISSQMERTNHIEGDITSNREASPKPDSEHSTQSTHRAKSFVATTTSGLAANMSYTQKLDVWRDLGDWVKVRRER